MFEGKKIAVVVPAYNEELLITRVLETMPGFVDAVYVVDDQSRDATREKVREFIEREDRAVRVVLIVHEVNQGVGAAINTGYKRAVQDGMEVVAVMASVAAINRAVIFFMVRLIFVVWTSRITRYVAGG